MTLDALLQNPLNLAQRDAHGTGIGDLIRNRVAAFQKQQADITIVTAEGDRVTLSSTLQTSAAYATYDQFARTGENEQRGQLSGLAVQHSKSVSITVEGNLSQEELRDIHKAIQAIREVGSAFVAGDQEEAAQGAGTISQLGTIASLNASLSFEQAVLVQRQAPPPEVDPGEEPLGPTATPVAEESGESSRSDRIRNLVDKITELIEESSVEPAKLVRPLSRLFARFLRRLDQNEETDPSRLELARQVTSEVLDRVKALVESEETEETEETSTDESGSPANSEREDPSSAELA